MGDYTVLCKKCGDTLSPVGFCHKCRKFDLDCPDLIDMSDIHAERQCEICGGCFTVVKQYEEHVTGHPKCWCCNNRFKSKKELFLHLDVHSEPMCIEFSEPFTENADEYSYCIVCDRFFYCRLFLYADYFQILICDSKKFSSHTGLT
jgi:hypothetical protein